VGDHKNTVKPELYVIYLPKRREKELVALFKDVNGNLDPRYHSIKTIFQAPPGYVFIEGDWNQAELWTLGYLANDEDFIHVLETSDVHTATMQEAFKDFVYDGKPLSAYSVQELNQIRKTEKIVDSLRVSAKSVKVMYNKRN